MKKTIIKFAFLIALICPLEALAVEKIIFSISPQRNVSELAKLWIPILNEIQNQSGLEITFTTATDAKTFNKRLKRTEADAAFIDPYAFSSLSKDNYSAFAKPLNLDKEADHLGIIVVRKDTPFQTIDDLAGKVFSFPNTESFSASVLPRFHMQATQTPYKAMFTRSGISSALSVLRGFSDAAGLEVSVYNSMPYAFKQNLRIVWTSTPSDLCRGMKNHPFVFAIKKSLPIEVKDKLAKAVMSMNETPKGKRLLKSLGFKEIQVATNSEWAGLSNLATRVLIEK